MSASSDKGTAGGVGGCATDCSVRDRHKEDSAVVLARGRDLADGSDSWRDIHMQSRLQLSAAFRAAKRWILLVSDGPCLHIAPMLALAGDPWM